MHTQVRPYEERFPDWGEWGERILRGPVPFEVLDSLAELVVGKMDESARFAELLGYIGLILRISDINEGIEAFGQKVHLMAEPFDQYPAMALDLVDPVIYFIEPAVYFIEPLVYPLEPMVYPLEPAVYPVEPAVYPFEPLIQPMNKPMKTFVQVLNKFRVHAASAVKLNGKLLSRSCQ